MNPIWRCHPLILITALLLTGLGVLAVYSASAIVAMDRHQDPYFFLKRHVLYAMLGSVAMMLGMQVDYHGLRRWTYPCLLVALILLVVVLLPPFAKEVGGAKRWIELGPLSFQPAEVAKLTLILYLAHALVKKQAQLTRLVEGYLPLMAVVGTFFLLVLLQPDLGTAVVLAGIAGVLLFVGGVPASYLLGSLLAILPLLYVAIAHVGFRRRRILAFWDPWSDRADAGFQVVQSLLALGKGGIMGVGPGAGKQKLFFLPEAHTDFVLAVIGEEFGFIGCALLLGLFGILLWGGMTVAWRTDDLFARYLACGITSMIVLQAIVHVAVVVGFLPPKGLPLPLVSFGGSSLLVTLLAVGILLGISARLPMKKVMSDE
jgi:cell division protein FtsW